MLKTTSPLAIETKAKRGFGLIDVSLGIIAGIGLLVGAVILFQQVSTNNAVSELTRNSVSISSEIRAAARNMTNFGGLPGADTDGVATGDAASAQDGRIALASFGLEPALTANVRAETTGTGDSQFELDFGGLSARACNRAAVTPANLGANVASAICVDTDSSGSVDTLRVTYNR